MDLTANIRKETPDDYQWVVELTERAFKAMPFSDGDEGELVANLHQSDTIHKYKTSLAIRMEKAGRVYHR